MCGPLSPFEPTRGLGGQWGPLRLLDGGCADSLDEFTKGLSPSPLFRGLKEFLSPLAAPAEFHLSASLAIRSFFLASLDFISSWLLLGPLCLHAAIVVDRLEHFERQLPNVVLDLFSQAVATDPCRAKRSRVDFQLQFACEHEVIPRAPRVRLGVELPLGGFPNLNTNSQP